MSGCGGRRTFLAGLAALAGAAAHPARGASAARTRLILLGTGGGPRARRNSSAPAQVMVVGERAYVVDCGNGVELARGADVLVHEALYEAAIDRLVARVPNAATFRWHFRATHTSAADAGRAAAAAGVKTLVLSHFVPPDDSAVTDGMWRDAARAHFRGRVIVGKDLMEI